MRNSFYLLPREMVYDNVSQVQKAGFTYWEPPGAPKGAGAWVTSCRYTALSLHTRAADYVTMDSDTFNILQPMLDDIDSSRAIAPAPFSASMAIPAPIGCEYMPFQVQGIQHISQKLLNGQKSILLADPQGVGKTIQAIGVANHLLLPPARILVIGPASLRLNWQREIEKWSAFAAKAWPVLRGNQTRIMEQRTGPLVCSYELTLNPLWLDYILSQPWDLVVFDEAHYLKNIEAKRTRICLNQIAATVRWVLMLSGTPIPNRPHEFFGYLNALAPDVISGMDEMAFNNRYTTGHYTPYGWKFTGGRNHEELGMRLRSSGWMIRREKREVLPQLPPERHHIIVFPTNSKTAKIVRKEQENTAFSAHEILAAGEPLGFGPIPELRHEMGLEKVEDCVKWVKDQLEGGLEKIVLFAYHQDVIDLTFEALKRYKPARVYGPTPPTMRQSEVDRFQNDPECRVIVGGWKPMGTGWTLTASYVVAFIEASFVPGDNDQCKDRLIRIGQTAEGVYVIFLVVEGSTEATVLSIAAGKAHDTTKVLA